MILPPPPDQEQRRQAIDPSLSIHLEAPAGSGKTTVLMKRYLTLLALVREPEEILALTFTRKAAGELRTRIQGELQARVEATNQHPSDPHKAELQELGQAVLQKHIDKGVSFLERLRISTFHAFCAQLLRLAPHEAGLPPDFGLLEEQEGKRLQKDAIELMRRRLADLPAADPVRQALVRRLVRLNNDWPRLAAELQGLLARRDILSDFITLARESRDPAAYETILRDHLSTMILPGLAKLSQEFRQSELGRQWPELFRYLADSGADLAATLTAAVPGTDLDDLHAWQALADGLLTKQGKCYKSFTNKFPKNIKDTHWCSLLQNLPELLVQRLNNFRTLPGILLQPDEVPGVQDLIILLNQALTTYEELCLSRRSLDFTALEQKALKFLSGDNLPDLLLRLDHRLTHLLVDEFQDTSVNQMDLLCRLLAGWQGDPQRSLMVVGDPKQSIYGWRQARVELFFQSRDAKRLPCSGAPPFETLALETNFRSTQALIRWANEVFGGTVMNDREKSGVHFRAAVPAPGAEAGEYPGLSLFVGGDRTTGRELEAAWLARELSLIRTKLAPEETVGVLIFVRTHLPIYLTACRRAGLSLRVRDGLPLRESLAVQHLHNAATALVRPHDDVAWAALLRGFAGPQPLGLLAEIAAASGDFWSEKITRYANSPQCSPQVWEFHQALTAAGKRVGREPLSEILPTWLDRVAGWRQAADWEGPLGVANARAYLDLLATAAAVTPEDTLSRIEDMLGAAYQPPDPRAQDSPVEVLTVHAAKGLEYDYVYVPQIDWEPLQTGKNDAPFLLEEVSGKGTAVMALKSSYLQKEKSILYETLDKAAKQRALGEARRLFYVAVTRARKRLRISGVVKQAKNGEWKFPHKSPLGWLQQHYAEAELTTSVINFWQSPPLSVTINAEVAKVPVQAETPEPSPPAYDIQPELRPYIVQFPSQLAGEYGNEDSDHTSRSILPNSSFPLGGEGQGKGVEPDPFARWRGEISHRLLECLSHGEPLPQPAVVAQALQSGAPFNGDALTLAEEILAEIQACQQDPFLAPLLDPNLPIARSEWLLEAWTSPRTLYRGKMDRLVFDGRQWWLLDYKTSRPVAGVAWDIFLRQEVEKYRPQLLAYRDMAAKYFDLHPPEMINVILYFTAARRHVFI